MKNNKQDFINKFNLTDRHNYYISKNDSTSQDEKEKTKGTNYSNGTKKDLYSSFESLLNSGKISIDDLVHLGNNYGRFVGQNATHSTINWREYPQIRHILRNNLDKQLGEFTLNALNKIPGFKGIELVKDLKGNAGYGEVVANGIFDPINKKIKLNKDEYNHDVLSTIIHEGNHVIESQNDYSNEAFRSLPQFKGKTNFIPETRSIKQIYGGVQDILNLPRFKENYGPDKLGPSVIQNWKEIPAHALQSWMSGFAGRENNVTPYNNWKINNIMNQDSRKLLRRIMKETHQAYKGYGLNDSTTAENKEVQEPYSYNKQRLPLYNVPNKYSELNKTFLDVIEALKKPEALRKNFTGTQQVERSCKPSPRNEVQTQRQGFTQPSSLFEQANSVSNNPVPSPQNLDLGQQFQGGSNINQGTAGEQTEAQKIMAKIREKKSIFKLEKQRKMVKLNPPQSPQMAKGGRVNTSKLQKLLLQLREMMA